MRVYTLKGGSVRIKVWNWREHTSSVGVKALWVRQERTDQVSALWSKVGIILLVTPNTEDREQFCQVLPRGMEIEQIFPLSVRSIIYSTSPTPYPAGLCPGDCLMGLAGTTPAVALIP